MDKQVLIQRRLERELQRRERRTRRRERWTYLSGLIGNIAGTAFGTKKIGWVLMAVVVVLSILVARKWGAF